MKKVKHPKKQEYYRKNREKILAQRKSTYDPESRRERTLRENYNMSVNDYFDMLNSQGGGCAICSTCPPQGSPLKVDHNHDTGEVRGLLCQNCNIGLGHFKDSPSLLYRGIAYLGH